MNQLRFIRIVHSLEGRIRLRLSWLNGASEEVNAIADELAELDGMIEVQVRRYTGSVLCHYDPEVLHTDDIVSALRAHTGVERVLQTDDEAPREIPTRARSSVARAVKQSVGELDRELQVATNGSLDLGTTAALGFFALGAAEIAFTRKLPMPPWFNLAWWAFRTFTTFESDSGANPEMSTAVPTPPTRRKRV